MQAAPWAGGERLARECAIGGKVKVVVFFVGVGFAT
jgi:hypothetical protein